MSNPHDKLMQRAWQNCRAGMSLCVRDEHAWQKALAFSQRALAVAPSHMQRWIEILNGEQAVKLRELFTTASFFDLSRAEQAWWDPLIQSAPFAGVLQPPKRDDTLKASHSTEQRAMTLEQFDHICRAAAAIAGVKKVYVFGANAIIPWLANAGHPIPLPDFQPSRELDISAGDEKLDTLIDGAIGEFSTFDETFSVYAHGLSLASFQTPSNWLERADKRIEPVSGIEIVVPHPHDLVISKLVVGRPKDFDFATCVQRFYPMSALSIETLLLEFEQAHPNALSTLRQHLEVWQATEPSLTK